jgi:HEAT repeat protein
MQQESIQAALALVLGPETEYQVRARATRRIARQGPAILPFLLNTLSNYPEITTPAWPWWPPQYEHTSRLLLHLSQRAHIPLTDLLHHMALEQLPGPVLWTSLMEAAGLLPHVNNEEFLCQGLETYWASVRYTAAMALVARAKKSPLQQSTLKVLQSHQGSDEEFPVRLTTSYALLCSGEYIGLETLESFLLPHTPAEVRKAATFILATELPIPLSVSQRTRLNMLLLRLLHDPDPTIGQQAAHALSKIAGPALLSTLYEQLENAPIRTQIIILTALEELTQRKTMRYHMRQHALPTRLLPLIKSADPDLRRQVCYTLAACGGEYVAAVLGTIVMNKEEIGRGEALESLRFLQGALRAPLRGNIIRWLLQVLPTTDEEIQVTVLDSLTHLLWQAYNHGRKQAWKEIRYELTHEGTALRLLHAPNPLIRQRALELLPALGDFLNITPELHYPLQYIMLTDSDSGVRACAAYICGKTNARWAISALLRALADPDEHVSHTALNAIARITTPDDPIILYAVTELAQLKDDNHAPMHNLARAAISLLKKWKKSEQDEIRKSLHSFR